MLEFPRKLRSLDIDITHRMKWSGTVQEHSSGSEGRLSYWSEPLWEFDLKFNGLRDGFWDGNSYEELSKIEGLFGVSAGTTQGFSFFNKRANAVARQHIGAGPVSTLDLVRSYGPASLPTFQGTEHIGLLDTSVPFALYIATSDVPIDPNDPVFGYTLGTTTPGMQQVVFNSPPVPGGHVFVADFGYLFYARFKEMAQEFDRFAQNLYTMKRTTLCTLRAEAL